MGLLKDADQIRYRGVVSEKEMMKQIVARAPDSLKSMLIQAGETSGWYNFRRCAENYAWVSFPDKIVNAINKIERIEDEHNKEKNNSWKKTGNKYCRLHGEGNHATCDCDIIKLIEKKGWRRNLMRSAVRNIVEQDYEQAFTQNNGNKKW